MRPHQQHDAELALEVDRCVDSQLAQGDRIAYYKDLVPSRNGGCAYCERSDPDFATSDQENDEPYG